MCKWIYDQSGEGFKRNMPVLVTMYTCLFFFAARQIRSDFMEHDNIYYEGPPCYRHFLSEHMVCCFTFTVCFFYLNLTEFMNLRILRSFTHMNENLWKIRIFQSVPFYWCYHTLSVHSHKLTGICSSTPRFISIHISRNTLTKSIGSPNDFATESIQFYAESVFPIEQYLPFDRM